MSRILNSAFVWIGSATHDTSDAFRQRQRERIRRMQKSPKGEVAGRPETAAREEQCTPASQWAANQDAPGMRVSRNDRRMQNNDKGPDKLCNEPNRAIGSPEVGPASPFARKEGK